MEKTPATVKLSVQVASVISSSCFAIVWISSTVRGKLIFSTWCASVSDNKSDVMPMAANINRRRIICRFLDVALEEDVLPTSISLASFSIFIASLSRVSPSLVMEYGRKKERSRRKRRDNEISWKLTLEVVLFFFSSARPLGSLRAAASSSKFQMNRLKNFMLVCCV